MHSLVLISTKRSLRPFAASAALLMALGCAGASDDDGSDAPEFMGAPPAGFAGAASVAAPGAAGSTTPQPGAAPAAGVGNGGAPTPAPAAGAEAPAGNVPLTPPSTTPPPAGNGGAGGSAAPAAGGVAGSADPGAAGAPAGSAGAGSVPAGAGPGRVGVELCPQGPFNNPLPNNAAPQQIASVGENNFFIFEGPVWTGDALYLSEIANGNASQIDRFTPGAGLERGVIPSTGSNGMALDADGNLVLAAHDVGGISRVTLATGAVTRGAQTRNGARFNSPNDLVVRGDGNVYFTDPDFQAPNGRTQDGTFVYRIAPPVDTGEVSVVDDSMNNPNGITLSPDGNTLYVSAAGVLRQYSLDAAGAATPIGDLTNNIGTPDGMTVDCAGNIYAVQNDARTITVFSPDGAMLGVIGGQNAFAQGVTNVAFGGPNRTTLFITTFSQGEAGGLYSVELGVPGFPY